jgi:lysophospholipase L1-like esterase
LVGLQVAIVGLLVADLIFTWALQGLSGTQRVLMASAVLGLALGARIGARILKGSTIPTALENALVALTSAVVVLPVIEVGLRLVAPDHSDYLRPPNTHTARALDDEPAPGVHGLANFTTNEWGLRGPSTELMSGKPNVLKIITVGGSTTASEFLDDSEEWSHLLMQQLNHQQDKTFVYVANAGVNGHNTADHLELLKRFTVLQNADVLVFLTGINDFSSALAFEGRSTHAELAARASADSFSTKARYPFYSRSRVYSLLDDLRPMLGLHRRNQTAAEWHAEKRRNRARGPIVPMPDLTLGREEYRTRVRELADQCRSMGKRCVFLTQPTMWRRDLTTEEERLLFYGWTGTVEEPTGFVRASDLAEGMSQFNEALLAECQINSLECYDLAAAIPKDATAFYDDCHFNEHGAKLVARFLADRLLNTSK